MEKKSAFITSQKTFPIKNLKRIHAWLQPKFRIYVLIDMQGRKHLKPMARKTSVSGLITSPRKRNYNYCFGLNN